MIKPQKNLDKIKSYPYPEPFGKKLRKNNLCAGGVLKLNYNEPTFSPSPKVISALLKTSKGMLNWYPEGSCAQLKEAIAGYTGKRASQIIVGNGSDEILHLIALTYLGDGDEVIIPIPNYEMFAANALSLGASLLKVPCRKDLSFDYRKIIAMTSEKTKAIYLSNPNTPTGTCLSREDICKIAKAAAGAILVVDEAYYEYSGLTVLDLLETCQNLVVVRTFSKAFSIAGLRLGYCITSKENAEHIAKEKELLPESVNLFAQVAGIAALEHTEYMMKQVASVKMARAFLQKKVQDIGVDAVPSAANFILMKLATTKLALKMKEKLELQGVFVRDRTYKPGLAGCLRIGLPVFGQAEILFLKIKNALFQALLDGVDTLLFDMDGVLVDVSRSYRLAIKKTAEHFLEKGISFEEIQAVKEQGNCNNDWDCTLTVLENNGMCPVREKVIAVFEGIYQNETRENESLLITIALLKKLRKKYKLGIVTGRPKQDAYYAIKRFNLEKVFGSIITFEDVARAKPSPEGLRKAMQELKAGKSVYFGDGVEDMAAAVNAHIPGIGILGASAGNKTIAALKKSGASLLIHDLSEVQG